MILIDFYSSKEESTEEEKLKQINFPKVDLNS